MQDTYINKDGRNVIRHTREQWGGIQSKKEFVWNTNWPTWAYPMLDKGKLDALGNMRVVNMLNMKLPVTDK